ncbi:MAG: DNA topoisomerase IV subunit A [Treponema porcinum]|uniref:DNA topoisomerase IV subunit A n=2 Tax=Treponemataceae TaxID=2845253 RepID=UPI002355C274|nr:MULTISPECIES: DNA topoisomerase IV subunit A [Treponema]MCI5644444.1 DNA topoisomerase IV subunit A [Treponema porcinum]MCI6178927.1 DNA topoisomerase IV subunit A [Treponema porcinum]MCI6721904.1 DNA topoisomerase IV subunit A [Treponema porcinum]MCI7079645.1 DNA topoisomerase IV subunit A [Treponema porcinum]MCI7116092.1 DNA topoisomerase IV subunit A [Treponema porcinum]
MAYVKNLFDSNFIQYASYVIRDRAIPEIIDGLKPVQRRILHTLLEKDDGRLTKVAKVCGDVATYHPHGDASIYTALVNLANKEIFIDKQGNYGNMYTGDGPAAPRYIECRLRPVTRDILYNPKITQYVPSYDGRAKEPVCFRAKLPLVLIMGAEGIAVGMSTQILSHNVHEVIEAEKKCLRGEPFQLFPDFQTGGLIDCSEYKDGLGKIVTRARMDTSDEKRIVITELPYGCTTESLMDSIEKAARTGKVKIASINDFTSATVNVEIKLPRGVYVKDVVDSLYAFTDCEKTVYCNLLVIKDNMPVQMTVTEVIEYHSKQLLGILKEELEVERAELMEKLHLRTLERIFIEERIYKSIEQMKTEEAVNKAVKDGFVPFRAEILRDITNDDIDHLLKIPIRRISLYDMNKNRKEVQAINARLKEISHLLKHLVDYAVTCLDGIEAKLNPATIKRRTELTNIRTVDVKTVVKRDTSLKYDEKNGYLGTAVSGGTELLKITPFDRILYVRKSGIYTVTEAPSKVFVGPEMRWCGFADKESLSKVLFTILYRDPQTQYVYIKRCKINAYIMNRDYFFAPDGMEVLHIDTRKNFSFALNYVPKPRVKILKESFKAQDYMEKGLKALGTRIVSKEVQSVTVE